MEIKIQNVKTLRGLIEAARSRELHRLLLTDYATVEPQHRHGAVALVGMISVVVTAFDRKDGTIFRWSVKNESKHMVSIVAETGKGPTPGEQLAVRKEQIRQILREEGFEVDEGEWTSEAARSFIEARQQLVG